MDSQSSQLFQDTLANVDLLLSSISDIAGRSDGPVPDLNQWRSDLQTAAKALSHEATKFAIAHSSPPYPEAAHLQGLSAGLCNAASHLAGAHLSLPHTVGHSFLRLVGGELKILLLGLKEFVETVHQGVAEGRSTQECLTATGILWEFCDQIPQLPKDNCCAVAALLAREEHLVQDALHEVEQSRVVRPGEASSSDSDEEQDASIRGAAVTALPSVKGLLKSALACLRKTRKLLKKPPQCEPVKLDPLAVRVSNLSTNSDDLVCSLYPPFNSDAVARHGRAQAALLRGLLADLSDYGVADESDQQWIHFLTNAVQHNLDTLEASLPAGEIPQ